MASDYDPTEFIDTDFQAQKNLYSFSGGATASSRAPTREEVDSRVTAAQQKLAELKRAQEELERERSGLEETRRRQMEFQAGRQEMVQNLTRGLGLLEEAEFNSRRDAEHMAKALAGFRDVLSKLEAVHQETWTSENFNIELTRALTAIENARMEWNSARLKFPLLSGQPANTDAAAPVAHAPDQSVFVGRSFLQLCKLGLALTWPVAVVILGVAAIFMAVLYRR